MTTRHLDFSSDGMRVSRLRGERETLFFVMIEFTSSQDGRETEQFQTSNSKQQVSLEEVVNSLYKQRTSNLFVAASQDITLIWIDTK